MFRRRFLRTTGAVGALGGLAGCLGSAGVGSSDSDVVLPEPDRGYESSDLPYPAWGERIPDVTVPAPLESREVNLRDIGKPTLLTYFYSHCRTVCPRLISTQRNIQAHAMSEGYADAIEIFPITFDPARDTAERLRSYAETMNVEPDAGNWHFLRPESKDRAKAVVQEEFGVAFQRTTPEDMDMYMFNHAALTHLVNADGFVERAYRSKSPDEEAIIADLETVRKA